MSQRHNNSVKESIEVFSWVGSTQHYIPRSVIDRSALHALIDGMEMEGKQ